MSGPWLDNPVKPAAPRTATHWVGCWSAHHHCAIAIIERVIDGAIADYATGPAVDLAQARALLDAWCTAAEDGEPLGPLRAQTLGWLG